MEKHKAVPVGGLTNKRLQEATATAADVLSGKTFYSKDRELKTGTMNSLNYVINESFAGNILKVSDIARLPAGKYRLDYALACRRYANYRHIADVTVIANGITVAAICSDALTFWHDVDGSTGMCFNFGSMELTLTEDADTYIQLDTTTAKTKNVWNAQCSFSMYRIGE